MQRIVNVDVWFDRAAFQPAQAVFGIASGGTSGRGLGLGFSEVIPVADSDYIYAAIGEELGLAGGAIVILALISSCCGLSHFHRARDMFTKLGSAGLRLLLDFRLWQHRRSLAAGPMTGITAFVVTGFRCHKLCLRYADALFAHQRARVVTAQL